jgi:putative protease
MELLSPAGSPEALRAAVQAGANAVYLGAGDFNARRGAANFSPEELEQGAAYCHLRGVKVYLTLNTLLYDRELAKAAELAALASRLGVDAVLVQDLGVAGILRRTAPDLPLHASTQMSVHDLEGVRFAADLGMERVVLSRELSRDQIAHICAHSPVEIEIFVHGALCMCYSGQCFFSSVVGGRSGNRGMCAQPCRLNYGWNGKANAPLLSLKDMSLAHFLQEMEEMGVACAKIEGRMKRPEYVSVVTRVYAAALREGRNPTAEELHSLEQAFSRQGFTDGFFEDKTGPHMFGVREKNPLPEELFAQQRRFYGKEQPLVGISVSAAVTAGEEAAVTVSDGPHSVTVRGSVPEGARTRPLDEAALEKQLTKTGGTPYYCENFTAQVGEGLSLPLSELNALRREALEQLSQLRTVRPQRSKGSYAPPARLENSSAEPVFTLWAEYAEQVTETLLAQKPASVALPLEELLSHLDTISQIIQSGAESAVVLPRILWDRERDAARAQLKTLRERGVSAAYASTWSGVRLAQELDFTVRGDFGLGVTNSETLAQLEKLGLSSAVLSFELRGERVRDLSKPLDTELLVYGRMPLMVMENCIIKNRTGKCACRWKTGKNPVLTDRKGAKFPVVHAYGCRNEIWNSTPIYLADKPNLWRRSGLWAARLRFTTETPGQCAAILEQYRTGMAVLPENFTRGLYFREVE